jgi:phage terminase large subunit-like protein
VGSDDSGSLRLGHSKLEDQMCTYTGEPGDESPDVLDAAVWALTELMLEKRGQTKLKVIR